MLKVKDLDYSLSLKLGDPVLNNDDGGIFDAAFRLHYLERAYGRLVRILPKLMLNHAPLFANTYEYLLQILEGDNQKGSAILLKDEDGNTKSVENISELFVKITNHSDNAVKYNGKATRIDQNKYLSVLSGDSELYLPSVTNKQIFYTILDNKIYLMPVFTNDYKYTELKTVFKSEPGAITIDASLPITSEYADLLITLAASEGMQDLGRADKVQLYMKDIMDQLSILKGYADLMKVKEGSTLNG